MQQNVSHNAGRLDELREVVRTHAFVQKQQHTRKQVKEGFKEGSGEEKEEGTTSDRDVVEPQELGFEDAYLLSVMDQYSPNDATMKRTFDYSKQKIQKALDWRENFWSQYYTEEVDSKVNSIVENEGYLRWIGLDVYSRPILLVRPHLLDWGRISKESVTPDLFYHIKMIDIGIYCMNLRRQQQQQPQQQHEANDAKTETGTIPAPTTFTVIADASQLGLSHVNFSLFRGLLEIVKEGYPDRLGDLYATPIGTFINVIWTTLYPLFPRNLRNKIHLLSEAETDNVLAEHLGAEALQHAKHLITADTDKPSLEQMKEVLL